MTNASDVTLEVTATADKTDRIPRAASGSSWANADTPSIHDIAGIDVFTK